MTTEHDHVWTVTYYHNKTRFGLGHDISEVCWGCMTCRKRNLSDHEFTLEALDMSKAEERT